ncbi:AMP-binding protein [Desertifilum sp. FACHB-1129]|uniref:AMP-dependent synthetase n=1 Tax=Desertifilum tharense IPPAS B-1220 TaxID=1781255 RepID=A0A1E5QHG7_9CYAN|nr:MULTISPECIES: AMP-binding protein [Desertifilum]MDA0211317.1 AMP-binding protein [Cyanobacteria bacterium FC1]MBD2314662.1 AMP-binding protein [Desertifilum sp. FACHB-1129]MBD2320278.1 AMP-binding protein [Desertifilum sp. FACHB-866]MBD2330406.1 AMP-binding protein [Desertifilum sp. FACHB-868]OEJ74132.1 AMP-dependent synthetase [Desertifilum tharense IPPAS B-1220]
MKNIAAILQHQAQLYPDAIAIIDRHSRQTSFSRLNQAAIHTASNLSAAGIQAGDAVLVFQPMSAELYIILIALFRLGAIALFLDPSAGKTHIERCCQLYRAKALIATPKAHFLRLISPAIRQIPLKFCVSPFCSLFRPTPATGDIYPATFETPALLTFTSGSTGYPKAAMRTHGFLLTQHQVLENHLQLQPGKVDLTTLPIFVLANLASGVTSLIPNVNLRQPGNINAAKVISQIQTYQPQSGVASPAFWERLAEACQQDGLILPSFRQIFSGGAPVFVSLIRRLQAIAPQAEVIAVYGSTEAEPIAERVSPRTLPDNASLGLCVGKPIPEIALKILRNQWGTPLSYSTPEAFDRDCLPSGEVGEIVVSGSHVLSGYLQGKGDSETKFDVSKQRWHRTGDLGYLDTEGQLWLLGRCSACIVDDEGILYPFAVEAIARQFSQVRHAAVISHQGKRLLCLELQSPLPDLAILHRALDWAKLSEIQILSKIPVDKRHNAKIDYPALQQILAQNSKA